MTDRGRFPSLAQTRAASARRSRARRARPRLRRRPAVDLGPLPQWRLDDLYEGMDSPRFAADLARAATEAKRFAATLSAASSPSWPRAPDAGRALVRGGPRLRGAAGPDGPHHVLRFAALRRRHQRSRARQVLRRRAGEGDRARRRAAVLRAGAQPARRRRARRGDARFAARPLSSVARSTSARSGRTSSATSSSNCSSKSRCRAPPRGTGCSTRRSPRCVSPSKARS